VVWRRCSAGGVFGAEQLRRTILLGEVGLGGRLRPVRGILPATLAAQQAGFPRVIVSLRQAGEAKLVEGIEVFGIASITQLVAFLRGVPMRRDALEVSAVHSLAGLLIITPAFVVVTNAPGSLSCAPEASFRTHRDHTRQAARRLAKPFFSQAFRAAVRG
jgi:Subunit ChlI of Mg-chelatase